MVGVGAAGVLLDQNWRATLHRSRRRLGRAARFTVAASSAFSKNERLVELSRGQALFEVFKDASRPFIVVSDSARVKAVGTQFDVNHHKQGIVVTVVEGRVAVTQPSTTQPMFSGRWRPGDMDRTSRRAPSAPTLIARWLGLIDVSFSTTPC